jgi:hypothetical protein
MLDHVALYGNVSMARSFCSRCKTFAFVLDGRIQCCNAEVEFVASGIQRMSEPEKKRRPPSVSNRREILQAQDNRCLYCEQCFGSTVQIGRRIVVLVLRWDHLDPYCYSFNNHSENFAAACQFCNAWKSGFSFHSLEEIRVYVKNKWASVVPIPRMREELREAETMAEVLQSAVPRPILEPPESSDQCATSDLEQPREGTVASPPPGRKAKSKTRGISRHFLENPVFLTCWCGKPFQQKCDNQMYCSPYHRVLASAMRNLGTKVPPPASPPQRKKEKPPPEPLDSKIVLRGD